MSAPLFIKNASIKIGNVEYADLVSNVVLTPTTPTLTFKGVSGKSFQSVGAVSYVLQFDYAQDWSSADSLALKLFNDEGENVTVTIVPEVGSGNPSFTVEATLQAGAIGGAVDAAATASVTLPVTGKPVLGAAA
jgi:hypothetical protein